MAKAKMTPVVTYDRDAVLETVHVAAALRVHRDRVAGLDLPCFYVGARPRFLWGQLLDFWAKQALPDEEDAPLQVRRRRKLRAAD